MAGESTIPQATAFDLRSERANEMFLKPIFLSDNILNNLWMRVMTNVKQDATMFFAGGLSQIIKKNTSCKWAPKGKMEITQRPIVTMKHEVQLSLCTDEFWNTCLEWATGNEEDIFTLDDEETGRVIRDAWIARVQQGIVNDMFDLGFFADTDSVLEFYQQNNGWFKAIDADIAAGNTPAAVPTGSGSPLAPGDSVDIFDAMIAQQTAVFKKMPGNTKVLMVSDSIYQNYKQFLGSQPLESSFMILQEGLQERIPLYCGIPVVCCPQFDEFDNVTSGGTDVHRALLTFGQNLTVATDVRDSSTRFSLEFFRRTKEWDIESYFRLGFNVAHPELVVLGL